jgi:hypothetical protein
MEECCFKNMKNVVEQVRRQIKLPDQLIEVKATPYPSLCFKVAPN